MKDVKVNINPTGFPSQFVSDAEKKSFEFRITNRSSYSIRMV